MAIEIERKFLVVGDAWRSVPGVYYCQGYLSRDPQRTVRIRVFDNQALLTIKSLTTQLTRAEFEYPVPLEDAQQILKLCETPLIEKNRHVVQYEGMDWEVDEFLGENQGLIVAEIELTSESQAFKVPDWVGEEVSDDPRYFNSSLSKLPYRRWSEPGADLS